MTNNSTNTYEGLFLLPQAAGSDLSNAADLVKSLLEKVGAEIIAFSKWDERRLAYEIKGNKRGVFFLCYFKLAGDQMAALERHCLLSEDLLRFMLTRADQVNAELIETAEGRDALKEEIAVRAQQAEEGASEAGVRATTKADRDAEEEAAAAAEAPAEEAPAEEAPAANDVEAAAEDTQAPAEA